MDDCCVEFRIYIHNKLQIESVEYEEELRSLLTEYSAYLSQFIGDYIWQNESFSVSLAPKHDNAVPHLWGQTHYGDNVEDEWFIVFLLFQLSSKYSEISISVNDCDGNFLLIEAAHKLPRWLNPDSSENRVFIHGGKLHIIPLPSSPREITVFPTGSPSLLHALEIIHGPHNTLANLEIQQAVRTRIDGYPEKAHQSYHHGNCLVPPSVKYLLDQKPTLVSAAVQAFCHRDPIDMKALKEAKHFPPTERVLTRVQFTRCLYAQLMQQDFQPGRKSEWRIPPASSTLYKPHQLGLKLTCGFEILCSKCLVINESTNKPSGAEWQRFLGFLTEQGYFKVVFFQKCSLENYYSADGEIEGSKLYSKLMSQAEHHFVETLRQGDTKKTSGDTILSLLHNAEINLERMKEEEQKLPPEDDDKWLNISAAELDAMLQNYSASGNTMSKPSPDTNDSQEDEFNLESVTQTMKSFVQKVSSHEGAEFPEENENEEIDFDADSFLDTMKQLLEGRPAPLQSDSDDDDEYLSDLSDEDDEGRGELSTYMDDMDRELAQTKIGESFEK
ncbi:hypothetical protein QZH41_019057, partial [Actinostola sp. cb2023]